MVEKLFLILYRTENNVDVDDDVLVVLETVSGSTRGSKEKRVTNKVMSPL